MPFITKINSDDRSVIIGSRYCDFKVVLDLLKKGGNCNFIDSRTNFTPLHCAILNHNLDVVKLLVENGADINLGIIMKSNRLHENLRWTPFLLAVKENQIEIMEYLKTKGASEDIAYFEYEAIEI